MKPIIIMCIAEVHPYYLLTLDLTLPTSQHTPSLFSPPHVPNDLFMGMYRAEVDEKLQLKQFLPSRDVGDLYSEIVTRTNHCRLGH